MKMTDGRTLKRIQVSSMVCRAAYFLAKSYLELLSTPALGRSLLISRFAWQGLEHLENAVGVGAGVIAVSAHLGAFDLLGCATAARGYPLMVVSRTPKSRLIQRIWNYYRSNFGILIVPERNSLNQVREWLKRGGIVVIMLDQNVHRDRGIFVNFLGRPACTLDTAAILALRHAVPVVPVFTAHVSNGFHRAEFQAPRRYRRSGNLARDIKEVTQDLTSIIEMKVRETPEQWLWFHRRWKTQPPTDEREIRDRNPSHQ